jgi:hypothetical protein
MECIVCYEENIKFKPLKCNHKLCVNCYERLNNNLCPYCRIVIKEKYNFLEYYLNILKIIILILLIVDYLCSGELLLSSLDIFNIYLLIFIL